MSRRAPSPGAPTGALALSQRHARRLRAVWLTAAYLVLIAGGITFIAPLLWVASTSLKEPGVIFTHPPRWIPRRFLKTWAQERVKVEGKWRPVYRGSRQGERIEFATLDPVAGGVPIEVQKPAFRHGERLSVPESWLEKQAEPVGEERLLFYATDDRGRQLKVAELRSIPGAKVSEIVEPASRRGEVIVLPLYRPSGRVGRSVEVHRYVTEVHFNWENYYTRDPAKQLDSAWTALTLERPAYGFHLPYALRWEWGGRTYQWGPPRWEGLHIKSAFLVFYLNSIIVAGSVTIGQVLTCSLAAYAFARLRFPGRDTLFLGYLATMMIPGVVTMIPVFILLKLMHLIDTYAALILPGMFSAYGTFMLRQFFLSIPPELEDAARIDGCSKWSIYWNVILPLSRPALATLTTFVFLHQWNDFMWPLIVIHSMEKKTLMIGLYSFMGQYETKWHLLMAASMMVMAPVLAVFVAGQKFFVRGIVLSGLKG